MKFQSVGLCVAFAALIAGCAQSSTPGKSQGPAKDAKAEGPAGADKIKPDTAAQMTGHGFALVEGDDTAANVQTLASDVATAAAAPDAKGKGDWCEGQDWKGFVKAPPISRWRITILDADQNPAVGATVAVRKLAMGGKKGYVALDALKKHSDHSNIFTVYVAAGRHYEVSVTTQGGVAMKHLNFDSRRAVDVAFPIILDSTGGQEIVVPGKQKPADDCCGIAQQPPPHPQGTGTATGTGSPMLPVEVPTQLPAAKPPVDQGVWPWCFDDRPIAATDSPEAAAEQVQYMKGKMAKLETVVRCRLGDEWDRVVGAVNTWAKGKPWHWHHFACDKWPALGVWATNEENGERVKLAFSDLSAVVSMDPDNPKACDGSLKAEINAATPFAPAASTATGDGSGLYACNRGKLDTMDLFEQLKTAGTAEAIAAMKAHIARNEDVSSCSLEGTGVAATVVITFGADVIRVRLASFSPEFLD